MAAKARVHELAKELNVTSKDILQKLSDLGEFVKSASSTVEAPVARRLREQFGGGQSHKTAKAKSSSDTSQPQGSNYDKPAAKSHKAPQVGSTASQDRPESIDAQAKSAKKDINEATHLATSPSAPSAHDNRTSSSPSVASASAVGSYDTKNTIPTPHTQIESNTGHGERPGLSGQHPIPKPPSDSHSPAIPRPKFPQRPQQNTSKIANNPYSSNVPRSNPNSHGPRPQGSQGHGQGSGPGSASHSSSAQRSGGPGTSNSHNGPRSGGPGGHGGHGIRPSPGQRSGNSAQPGSGRPGSHPGASGAHNNPHNPRPGGHPGPRPGAGNFAGQRPNGPRGTGQGGSSNHTGHSSGRPGAPGLRGPVPGGHSGPRPGGHPGPRPGSHGTGSGGSRGAFPSPSSLPGVAPGGGASRPGGRSSRAGSGPGGAFGKQGSSNGAPYSKKSKKSKKQKRTEFDSIEAPELGGVRLPRGSGEIVRLARGASLSDFAEKINANPAALVQALFNLGEMVTATQSVSEEILQLLGAEINFEVVVVSPEDEDRELLQNFDVTFGDDGDDADQLEARPPVVTVMGHVDHGKTRLLDTIRSANVHEGEAGGITQHIGAYQVAVDFEGSDRLVTFIDTPGHEAFTAMRARGARATDIAVLVVAADDGVMPQTVEAINHAQAADVPIVVAVNKIDKEGANPERIRTQLTEFNLIAEEYGGQTMFVDISARNNINIDKLLEAILLTADASLDLVANPHMPAQGVAIEAHLDRGRGPVATVIIQRGSLHVGDSIVAGDAYGRVRRMLDDNGDDVIVATPSRPVQVIGFTSVPGAGDNFLVVEEDRIARQIADRRNARKRNAQQAKARKRISLEDLDEALKNSSQLNLILKGDNAGTVEALEESLLAIEIDDEVQLRVIDRGVGGVTETNVNLAAASDAIIIAFNVRPEGKANELANREGVDIRYYTVIYQAIEEVEKALKGMLKPIYEESDLGSAEIREIFKSSKFGTIAGCMVTSGVIKRNAKARIIRDSSVIAEVATIVSLRREKDDVGEVREGFECGLTLSYSDFKIGDIIESYELVEKQRV